MARQIFTLLIIVSYFQSSAQLGPMASYPFNNNANDASGNGHNGLVTNAVLSNDRFGNTNSSYYFNGSNSFINIGTGFNTTSFSISGWALRDTTGFDGSNVMISKINNGPYDYQNFEMSFNGIATGSGVSWDYLASTNSTYNPDSTWVHCVTTYNNSSKKIKFYVNNQVDSTTLTNYIDVFTTPIYIGARPYWSGTNSTTFYFKGWLDDFHIYNYEISPAKVDSLYNIGNWTNVNSTESSDFITEINYYNIDGYKIFPPLYGFYIKETKFKSGLCNRQKCIAITAD